MDYTPAKRPDRISPYLAYRDAPAAIDFLCRAFGFVERFRYPMDDGRIGHAELDYLDGTVMLASAWEGFSLSPLDLPARHGQVYMRVDGLDAHHDRARAAGATIIAAPEEAHGSRSYRAMDPEGHHWLFTAT